MEVDAKRRPVVAAANPAHPASLRSENLKGITAMVFAVAAFSAMDTMLKLFAQHYPPMQITMLRGVASLPFILLAIIATGRLRELKPVRVSLHLVRGLLSIGMLYGFVFGIRTLSLADAYSIYLSAPLIIAAVSVPLLGERIGWRRWLAIGTGLIGVLTILRPSTSSFLNIGALAVFASAVTYALSAIIVSVLKRTDTAVSTVVWQLAVLTVGAGVLALPVWRPIAFEHLPWLVGVGFFGALAQGLITSAFRTASPSVVAPFEYTALLWGIGIDFVLWDVFPSSRVYFGGSIVIASGLYLIWHERVAALTQMPAH
jgi:drug/metabolite transporter (DMT)-like permease